MSKQTATVIGLELQTRHRCGGAIECDLCGDIFYPNPVTETVQELRDQARTAGWTGDMTRQSNNDKCQNCNK